MDIQNKTESGMSFVELMIAGLLLLIVALITSTTFMSSSQTIIKSWDESVAVARAQELLEEIKGMRYEYIYQAAAIGTSVMDHIHLNVINPVIMPSGSTTANVNVRVIAHTTDDYVATGYNLGSLNLTWEHDGTSTTAGSINGGLGSNNATITLTTNGIITQRLFGTLSIAGTNPLVYQRIMVFPSQGETISDKDMIGTITMESSFVDDPVDRTRTTTPTDIFPEDYKQITITTIWGKQGGNRGSRQLVTIVAPKPASYYN